MAERYTYDDYLKRLREDARKTVPDAVQAIRVAVKLHGPREVQAQIAEAVPQPVDRSTYKRSFRYEDIPGGATVYNFSKHAPIIERGRRAGARMPPIAAITAWVFRKGLAKSSNKTFATGAQYRAARSLAYVIARAIQRRGLPAHWIMRDASKQIDQHVRRAIGAMLDKRGT